MSDSRVNQPILWTQALGKQVNTGEQQLAILQNIELQVNPGEAVAIIGASGSGKSTLLGLLAGLDLPTTGKVHLDGVDIFALDEDSRAALRGRVLGFVFQSFQLLPALTAIENVMLPLELAATGDAETTARRLLERVGLGKRLHHYPKQLSGGEQQRVAIARAFATAPKLLLADEPTGNLDPKTADHVFNVLKEQTLRLKAILIMATHNMELARFLDRKATLVAGKLQ